MAAGGTPFFGQVVAVADGDSITVLDGDKVQHKVRLWGIDAPEKGQDYGNRSRQAVSEMVFQQSVKVDVVGKDRYGRSIGKVYVGDLYVNLAMIKKGMAWWYRQYAPKDFELRDAEVKAKADKVGLWGREDAMPPWEWRKKGRTAPKVNESAQVEAKQGDYWITDSSGKTHNSSCRHYEKSKGRASKTGSGDNCKVCGGAS